MKRIGSVLPVMAVIVLLISCTPKPATLSSTFPDGTDIPAWFFDTTSVNIDDLGPRFLITDFGAVGDSVTLNTVAIQEAIDHAAAHGGGVVVIPEGRFRTGALFFKPGTHLHVSEGGILLGSDEITDFPKMPSRMEGRCIDYFPAVVNAYGVNGFTISGREPSTATAESTGKPSGNGGRRIRNAPTWKSAVRAWYSSGTATM